MLSKKFPIPGYNNAFLFMILKTDKTFLLQKKKKIESSIYSLFITLNVTDNFKNHLFYTPSFKLRHKSKCMFTLSYH